jgi:hypothetical protein
MAPEWRPTAPQREPDDNEHGDAGQLDGAPLGQRQVVGCLANGSL